MSALIFLSIAAVATAFKVMAIIVGLLWAYRHLLARTAHLAYRHTDTALPFRPAFRRR